MVVGGRDQAPIKNFDYVYASAGPTGFNKAMPATVTPRKQRKTPPARQRRRGARRFKFAAAILIAPAVLFYGFVFVGLLLFRSVNPATTAVQVERRLTAWMTGKPYVKRYRYVPLNAISTNLARAVTSAEDARFYQHAGFDWKEVDNAIHEDLENGRRRGASTIDQQLVRNLFLSTAPSIVRKALEFSIVPLEEMVLPKRRILELYLNVVEWGPGVYGAEAAAEFYYRLPARSLSRQRALELASILPAPLHRRPGQTEWYVRRIDARMHEVGW